MVMLDVHDIRHASSIVHLDTVNFQFRRIGRRSAELNSKDKVLPAVRNTQARTELTGYAAISCSNSVCNSTV
jgi:hypothetical protein